MPKLKLTAQLAVARSVMTRFRSKENRHFCKSILTEWEAKFLDSYYHLLPKRGSTLAEVTTKLAKTPLSHAFVFIHDFLKAHGEAPQLSALMKDMLTEVHKHEAISISRHLPSFIYLKPETKAAQKPAPRPRMRHLYPEL